MSSSSSSPPPSSWLTNVSPDSDFSLSNLPLGVFSVVPHIKRHVATRLGDTWIDLGVLESALLFADIPHLKANTFSNQETLNAFVEHSRPVWIAVRQRLVDLLSLQGRDNRLRLNQNLQKAAFHHDVKKNDIQMHLPIAVVEYTDFYSSREHATNVGTMFRGKDNALQPNWLHLPVGYHGRASTIVVSGTSIFRPKGQLQKDVKDASLGSIHAASRRLDFELEMAAVIGGKNNIHHHPLTVEQAKDRIFGFMLMNDWSARDIQKWEYVPLGPFTSKNFATTVSPWIIMAEALQDRVAPTSAGPLQDSPPPLEYLRDSNYSSYDVALTVALQTSAQTQAYVIAQSNFTNMYWNAAQQLAHHSVSGCVMRAGDLLGSGTISGSTPNSYGSLLELSWNGTQPVTFGDDGNERTTRTFLEDGDTVILSGVCASKATGQGRIGFGECRGTILPALTTTEVDQGEAEAAQNKDDDGNQERYQDFQLYGNWRSSCTWRVKVQLAAKAIDYEYIPIDLMQDEQNSESFLEMNPRGQVPLLQFTDTITKQTVQLSQSLAIIEFLDSVFPERYSLIPKDPFEKAVALEIVEQVNAGIQPLQNVSYLTELERRNEGKIPVDEQAKLVNETGLRALEVLVQRQRQRRDQSRHGPYCLGTFAPSIADAFLVPQMYNARRFGVDTKNLCPTLVEIEQVCLEHPWFKASHPEVQRDAMP